MSKKGLLFVLSGPSGGGKGTVVKRFRELVPDTGFSVSATTRAPREGETDGKDYYFVSREEFLRMIENGEMLEYNEFCGNLYGTPKKEADRAICTGSNLILEIESNGAFNVKKIFPEAILIMLIPESMKELGDRLRCRASEPEDVILKRLATAEHEVRMAPEYDYIVVNRKNQIEESALSLKGILVAEQRRSDRMKDEINNFLNNR